ncbi:MAG: MMPL family transporter, partial [Gammaproteobacteria bacterium]|nr:MMPL family transporter [Gammaproteobacteria bacterium]
KADYLPWVRSVSALVDGYREQYGDRVEFMTAGEPYFLAYMLLDLVEKSWLFIISLLIVIGVLWYEFRNWQGALLPLIGVGMTIALTLGLMGFTQFKLTTMMVLTPMLLLAIGIGHSVQITRRFMQELHSPDCKDEKHAAEVAIGHTIVPATLSIITDMVGFFTLSFVDISFYKAYAYFGMFGMATLLLTTTTLIPLLLVTFTPRKEESASERTWEVTMGRRISALLAGPGKWAPIAIVAGVMVVSANYAQLGTGIEAMMAENPTPEQSRIQREWDIMPGVEKGVNYSRAAFKDHFMLGGLFGEEEVMIGKEDNRRPSNVAAIHELERLGNIMPGVISVNIPIRAKSPILPECGPDAYNEEGDRLQGAETCYDADEDPVQGIFNDASVLGALNELEEWMRGHESIGYTGSYVQFVKTVNMIMATPDGGRPTDNLNLYDIPTEKHMLDTGNWYAYKDEEDPEYVPSADDLVQTYNGLLEANTSPGDLDSFVNTETWDEGIVMGFVNTMDPIATHKVTEDLQNFLVEHESQPGFNKLKIGFHNGEAVDIHVGTPGEAGYRHVSQIDGDPSITEPGVGGFLGATEATRVVAMSEWLKSPLTTALAIFLVTALMFRSLSVAAILVVMLFLTLFSQYGVGGYMTEIKEWSANLAFHVQVALSIAMGLGVDYGIYMVSRLREEMRATGGNWTESLQNTLSTTGSAVIVSVIVLLGSFVPLMNTELANTWSVSLYIGEALILDVITALTILPLLVLWLKPRFVFKPND